MIGRRMFPQLCKANFYAIEPIMSHAFSQTKQNYHSFSGETVPPKVLTDNGVAYEPRTDQEWLNSKPYKSLPGPSIFNMIWDALPVGKNRDVNMIEMNRRMRNLHGDIYRIKGILGKDDIVFTYNPKDFETVYRNEGMYPLRLGFESFRYYREEVRPDVFKGIQGLVTTQGKAWMNIRRKVNPILMKMQNIQQSLPQIDKISMEFVNRLETIRDPKTGLLNGVFFEELQKWSLESMCYIALNRRLGLLTGKADVDALKFARNIDIFFHNIYLYDVLPSIWPYYKTKGFKKFLKIYDEITDTCLRFIEEAKALKQQQTTTGTDEQNGGLGIFGKLVNIHDQVALVMAIDMLMAGIDTTSSTFTTLLYLLAKNPDKQERLRKELCEIIPTFDTPLTVEQIEQMPYLRSCLKESLRIMPITPGNMRVCVKDVVLSGYQIPAGTGVLMGVMELANSEEYFPRHKDFLPERWLKERHYGCPMTKKANDQKNESEKDLDQNSSSKCKNPFVYLPFGHGPRTCIGKRIAELELHTLTARLIRSYKITWTGNQELQYESNAITKPCGHIQFKFEKIDN